MAWDERLARRLKLKDLQLLAAVIEAGTMRKAADRLNYSQPAVSKAIANLERTIGQRLLERGRNGVELTACGEALLKCGVTVFDDLRKGFADIDFLSDPTNGEVRIGCTEPASAGIVTAAIDLLARRHSRIVFKVILGDTTSICRKLASRNVDLVITQFTDGIDDQTMNRESLYYEPIVIVAGAHHPSAHKRRVKLAELVDEPWVLPPNSFISTHLATAFRAAGLEPPCTTVVAPSAYLRIMLVAGGRFLTIVPAVMLRVSIKQLSIKRLPVDLPDNRRPVGIITLKDRALSPVAQLFIEHTRVVANRMMKS